MLAPNPPIADLVKIAKDELKARYGKEATIVAAAPGRVNLIGEHIDYCDGFVLPFAIERTVVIAAAPNGTTEVRAGTAFTSETACFAVCAPQNKATPKWSNYLRGVIHGFHERGVEVPGFDAFIISSLPGGAGLSSSAALECAVAVLILGLTGNTMPTKEMALLAQKAEHDYAGVPCGIMDQFASAFGKDGELVLIDCQTGEPEMVPFKHDDLTILISNTKVSHELSDGGYAARRKNTEDGLIAIGKGSWRDVSPADLDAAKEKMDEVTYRRSRHVVGEIARTIGAVESLRKGDFQEVGRLMYESHNSLRDDFEVSCPELDQLVETAATLGAAGGVIGARMTGGGFGGSTVTLCEASKAEAIAAAMVKSYEAKFGFPPEIFASRPAEGARRLS
ncbi:galactokinase [Luteolibacter algae]|uniref:Galactokinase n=1 Tax=Luteolibacter algae TaxID=454151 RepID=A0ABW5D4I1_9BACT